MRNYRIASAFAFLALVTASLTAVPFQAQGGNTATGTIKATAIRVLQVERLSSLVFGYIETEKKGGGTVVISAKDGSRRAKGKALASSDYSRAIFAVSGDAGKTYDIQLPKHITAEQDGSNSTPLKVVAVSAFSKNRNSKANTSFLDTSGKDTLYVGGTLVVPPGTPAGVYKAQFDVTVSYQ